jgi:hypothetical protein
MNRNLFVTAAAMAALIGTAAAQTLQRRATITGGGNPDQGKCTIEVVVDGAAEVEVRGDTATLRNLEGQLPQWRRFECSAPMPPNPGDFRFQGIDGRGRQQLVRDPRNGGIAAVRIEDSQGGSEGYTFDLIWNRSNGRVTQNYPAPPPPRYDDDRRGPGDDRRDYGYDRDSDAYHRDRDQYFRGEDWQRRLFDRVREDLNHVQRESFPEGGDRYRLASAFRELDELQRKLTQGIYDQREVDDVIVTLRDVIQDNRLRRPDREMLANDLERVRDFRNRHREFGAR